MRAGAAPALEPRHHNVPAIAITMSAAIVVKTSGFGRHTLRGATEADEAGTAPASAASTACFSRAVSGARNEALQWLRSIPWRSPKNKGGSHASMKTWTRRPRERATLASDRTFSLATDVGDQQTITA